MVARSRAGFGGRSICHSLPVALSLFDLGHDRDVRLARLLCAIDGAPRLIVVVLHPNRKDMDKLVVKRVIGGPLFDGGDRSSQRLKPEAAQPPFRFRQSPRQTQDRSTFADDYQT